MKEEIIKDISISAVFTAMWPNQPVKVCAKHARALIGVGKAIGLDVSLIAYLGDDDCINCLNEIKKKELNK